MAAPAHSSSLSPGSGAQTVPYAGMAWFLLGFELGPWEEYLIHELTPELERLTISDMPRIGWLQLDDRLIVPEFARGLIQARDQRLVLTFSQSRMSMQLLDGGAVIGRFGDAQRFEQSLLMSGVTHQVSDQSALTVSAILASQRFGTSRMNLRESRDRVPGGPYLQYDPAQAEKSHGAGVRFALSSELLEGLRLEAAYQSRIDMGEFASMRGVHGTHAELDIPSRVQVGLQVSATQHSWLNFGVSQIHYSEIGAFPSRSLPARFTALLGDRNSPQFAWSDLVVYNLGWHWRNASDLELFVDYSTRSQPMPSSPSLASILGSELAQNSLMLGVAKGVGNSRLQFNAAYAPPEYAFGGNVLGIVSDKLDQSIEVQALWSLDF